MAIPSPIKRNTYFASPPRTTAVFREDPSSAAALAKRGGAPASMAAVNNPRKLFLTAPLGIENLFCFITLSFKN
jgi:hypothetical protein